MSQPTPPSTPPVRPGRRGLRRLSVAALIAGGLSGIPSTVHSVHTGRSPLAATSAAGELLGRPGLARGVIAHVMVTVWWTAVLAALVPRRAGVLPAACRGAVGGAGIAALDMTIARRRFPEIAALPLGGQVADHVVFGAVVGTVLQFGRPGHRASPPRGHREARTAFTVHRSHARVSLRTKRTVPVRAPA